MSALTEGVTAAVIGALHNAHVGGGWSLVELRTDRDGDHLTFASGYVRPGKDERPYVVVTVAEV